jgi:hypothetical protein
MASLVPVYKGKNMITLQIPSGDKCQGCMFLLVICFPSDRAKCNLFKRDLNAKYEYGDMDISTIEKCEECPKEIDNKS